jgi:3-hydroxybutyryl-CoA dehydrogenase
MGAGIAEVCARHGLLVTVIERDANALVAGEERIRKSLERALGSNKITQGVFDDTLGNLTFSLDYAALTQSDLVIEAIAEVEELKFEVFRELDRVLEKDNAILASNTSSIQISRLASVTQRPDRVVGLHFFNPVPVLRLVEIIAGEATSTDTVERVRAFASEQLEKKPILAPDRAGFVVNFLLIPYLLSAIRLVEANLATAEDIDTGMVEGCAHPMGPLALADLIGLDTTLFIADTLFEDLHETQLVAPQLLCDMVTQGKLGRKSGEGFFSYAKK